MRKKIIVALVLLLFLNSCKEDYQRNLANSKQIKISSFPIEKDIKGEKININILGLHRISVIDTFIIGYDFRGRDNFLKIYSANSMGYLGSLISKGRGPNELFTVMSEDQFFCDSLGCYLWIADNGVLSKEYCLNITKSLKEETTVFDTNFVLINYPAPFRYLVNDSTFIGFNFDNYKNIELLKYNTLKRKTESKTKIFNKDFINEEHARVFGFQHTISNDRNYFACASIRLNQIYIFSTDFSDVLTLSVGDKDWSIQDILKTKYQDILVNYGDIVATDKYIFALYLNKSFNETYDENNPKGGEIHVFDWKGNPVMKMRIKENIWTLNIDEKNKYLYGNSPYEEIYRYDLKGFLY